MYVDPQPLLLESRLRILYENASGYFLLYEFISKKQIYF